jgi:hypothetical protein
VLQVIAFILQMIALLAVYTGRQQLPAAKLPIPYICNSNPCSSHHQYRPLYSNCSSTLMQWLP